MRVFAEITVQSNGRKHARWAEGSNDGEWSRGEDGEESSGVEKRRLPSEHLARASTHAASQTRDIRTEITWRRSRVTVRCTVGVLLVAAVLFGVRLAVAVGYGLGSAPGQDPGP